MAFNTAGAISTFVNPVFDDAIFIARDTNLMLPLVTSFNDRTGTALRKLQQYGTVAYQTINDYDDLSSQTFTPANLATLTPVEQGAQFFVTDLRQESDIFGAQADASAELGMGLAQKVELDVISDFASLTTNGTVGGAGTVITWGHVFAMQSVLRQAKAPFPYNLVLHPHQYNQLGKAAAVGATVTNQPDFQNQVQRDFYVGSYSGINIYTSANLGAAGTAVKCAMFAPSALAIDWRRMPRMEPQRDASRRGLELNMSTVYAHGIWRQEFGVQGIFDATRPVS